MDNTFLQAVVDSVRPILTGSSVARVWQPSQTTLVIDARISDGRVMFISVRPDAPAFFLADRSIVEADPNANADLAFGALLRKHIRGARVEAIRKPVGDRIVTVEFRGFAASGDVARHELVIALTGRSANVSLVDGDGRTVGSLRESGAPATPSSLSGPDPAATPLWSRALDRELKARAVDIGEEAARASIVAEMLAPPKRFRLYRDSTGRHMLSTLNLQSHAASSVEEFSDPSDAAESWWSARDEGDRHAARSRSVAQRIRVTRDRDVRSLEAMDEDLHAADAAERFREIAECLLAQQSTATSVDGGFAIVDFYSDDQSEIFVEADRGVTPQAVAEQYFGRHRKMRRTREAVAGRRPVVEARIAALDALTADLDVAQTAAQVDAVRDRLEELLGIRRTVKSGNARISESASVVRGARRYVSSDGYEILVGRTSATNDELTFKVARPSDIWLHAADYPGSHVVIRLPKRGDVPHRTLLEAAQLAAFYSQAKDDAIVDVRYTERKFVAKPRGAAPGLVRLQRFKSLSVRPSSDLARGSDA